MAYKKSKIELQTENWVDNFIAIEGRTPTYRELQSHFNICTSAAYARCKKFREKMNRTTLSSRCTVVSLKFNIPEENFEAFAKLLAKMKNLSVK